MEDFEAGRTRRDAILATLALAAAAPPLTTAAAEALPTGGAHDFDFYWGDWTAVNRRLKARWTAHPEWDVFPCTVRCQPYLGGAANVSEAIFPTKGFSGLTVRTFDAASRRWSVYWISSRGGGIGAPGVGGFRGNVGVFLGDDTDDGVPVKVRVRRTKRSADREFWEQAFSRDGGRVWETNWTADFTRVRR